MACAVVLIWACSVLVATASLAEGIGVNWGTQASANLHPNVIIQLCKDNNIDKVKLFDSDHWTVSFFANTGIEVMLGIPNNQLDRLGDYDNAKNWVKKNLTTHLYDGGVNIKYVAVGNEPFLTSYNGSFLKTLFPAVKNIQKAIADAGHGDKIKVTVPQNADVYDSGSSGPSNGNWRSDIRDLMNQIVQFFKENDCPFLVNIYPFLSLYQNPSFPMDFAFFDGYARPVQDNNISYTNMFDANLDTLVWSLKKAGAQNLKIIVGEIGWPTDGNINANSMLAQRFYDGLFKKMAAKKGTPLRPGPMDCYLFSLLDENMKSVAPGNFERHWGIFSYDGQPKFPVDFSGKGNDKMPIAAKNVQYLDKQWCALKPDIKNPSDANAQVEYACSMSDCTSLQYGSSCNNLDPRNKVSYAFNMYFQMQNQDVQACDFQGMAQIVQQNASTNNCLFPIQIQSAASRLNIAAGLSLLAGLLALFILV